MVIFWYVFAFFIFSVFESSIYLIGIIPALKRQNKFWLRLGIFVASLLAVTTLFAYISYTILLNNSFSYDVALPITMTMRFLLIFTIGAFFMSCFKEKFTTVLFLTVLIYAARDLLNVAYGMICTEFNYYTVYVFLFDSPSPWSIVIYIGLILVCSTLFYLLFAKSIKKTKKEMNRNSTLYLSILFAFAIVFFLVLSNTTAFLYQTDKRLSQLFSCVLLFVDFLIIMVFRFILFWLKDISEKNELNKFKEINLMQLETLEKNMNLINIKCHDMKHQVNDILAKKNLDEEYFKEVQETIHIYDASIATGNSTLDVILTQKSLECDINKIEFRVMLDGKALSFLSVSDINSLFGNALDNAIESLKKEKETDKRYILLNSKEKSGLLMIHIENYFSGELKKDESGNILTSKEDQSNHGFGIKSMKSTMDKYDGILQTGVADNTFSLDLTFPIPLV